MVFVFSVVFAAVVAVVFVGCVVVCIRVCSCVRPACKHQYTSLFGVVVIVFPRSPSGLNHIPKIPWDFYSGPDVRHEARFETFEKNTAEATEVV